MRDTEKPFTYAVWDESGDFRPGCKVHQHGCRRGIFFKHLLHHTAKLFFGLAICLWMAEAIFAQQPVEFARNVNVLHKIDQARISGEISPEKAILQKLYAGFEPRRMDTMFSADEGPPIKCMTPVLIEYERLRHELSPQAVATGDRLVQRIGSAQTASGETYVSPSGNFVLHYETQGNHAVPDDDADENGIPDYVEKAAAAADSSYRYQVETIGFDDFLLAEPYVIRFEQMGFYGLTRRIGQTTEIAIHNNFNGFPENNHPEGNRYGSLYATIAHEIKHAIQFAANQWQGDAGSTNWMEMDATMMEEVVHPDVDDYYNYIMAYDRISENWNRNSPNTNSLFGSPHRATPGSYWHVTWMLYYYETYGIEFWRDVWEQIGEDWQQNQHAEDKEYLAFFDAIGRQLQMHHSTLAAEHVQNHAWHAAAGPQKSGFEFGFADGDNYPNPVFREVIHFPPDSLLAETANAMAARYYSISPRSVLLGQPAVRLESDTQGANLAMAGFFNDGRVDVLQLADPAARGGVLQSTWNWSDLQEIIVVVVNNNRSQGITYNLYAESIVPEEDLISDNFPNPFSRQTTINFSVNYSKHVKVEVFDVAGRKIQTLADQHFNAGFHTLQFDGNGLASGVYFYRIITDEAVISNKMMLVK